MLDKNCGLGFFELNIGNNLDVRNRTHKELDNRTCDPETRATGLNNMDRWTQELQMVEPRSLTPLPFARFRVHVGLGESQKSSTCFLQEAQLRE